MGLEQPQCMSHDDWAELLLENRDDWEKAVELFLGTEITVVVARPRGP